MRRALIVISLLLAVPALGADKLRLERVVTNFAPTIFMYLSFHDSEEGRIITGRQKEDFKLILDSAEQGAATDVKTFDTLDEPINLVVVAQVSAAMNEVIDDEKRGIKALIESVPPKSKVGVLAFASDTKRLAELGNPSDAESAINNMVIDPEGVEVHMLDAVRTAIDLLNTVPPLPNQKLVAGQGPPQRKLILVFSDGIDVNMDKKSYTNIARRAQESGIVIDAVGYGPYEPAKVRNLTEMTKLSYGHLRAAQNASSVMGSLNNVSDEIRRQYRVQFEIAVTKGRHVFQVSADSAGKASFSNNIELEIQNAPPPRKGQGFWARWKWWIMGSVGVGLLMVLIIFAVMRRPEEVVYEQPPMPAPAPAPAPAPTGGGPRTMALDIGGGAGPALGWVVATNGKHAERTWKLRPARTVFGSATDCDVQLEDSFISTHHAEVRFEGGTYRLLDLGSTNGIVVNDKKVRDHILVDNDLFRLGKTEFKFKSIG